MPTIPAPKEPSALPDGSLPYQQINVNPDQFGAQAGRAMVQGGEDVSQIAMREQGIKNEADRVSAENELMARAQDLQNGNKDKGITGFRTLIGQQAVDALPDYNQKLQDAYKDVRSNLNPAVQRAFDQTAFRIVRGTTDSMGSYGAQQQVVGIHQEARSRVDLARTGAMTHADEPGGWDAHLADLQAASLFGSRALGLGPDATEDQRQRDVSKAYEERTKQLMLRDPMQAAQFYHDHIGAVVPDQRYELERALKVTTDSHYAKSDGQDAYHDSIGQTSAPALPQPVAGAKAQPYDQATVASRAKFVNSATPWDKEIAEAGKTYNVNPAEIKLKIAMESGGNPKAVNPVALSDGDHATGLGQFRATTAAQYGITDRTDPVQSINGIAKFLAAHGGTTGSDMHAADKAYNGSGPDAEQYAENARAVRQAAMGGGAPKPLTASDLEARESTVIASAQARAEARRPGDPAYRDQVVAEARRNLSVDLQALKGQDYSNFSSVLGASLQTKAQSLGDLPPDVQQVFSKLTPQNQIAIQAQFERNTRENNGEFAHSDPKLVNDLTKRIYLDQGDPQKITQPGQLSDYMGKGLNYTDQQRLIKEIQTANTPEGSPFLKQTNGVKETARKMLTTTLSGAALQHPELAEEAAYRFSLDLDKKIAAARTAKIDPQTLFQPGSKDYVLDPSRVAAFMPNESQIAASKAKAAPAAAPAGPSMWDRVKSVIGGTSAEAKPVAATSGVAAPAARKVTPRLPGESVADYLSRTAPA